jgi:hypothetical protein
VTSDTEQTRAGLTCSIFGSGPSASAHCLRFNDLWYDVFRIAEPSVSYDITVSIQQWNSTLLQYTEVCDMMIRYGYLGVVVVVV